MTTDQAAIPFRALIAHALDAVVVLDGAAVIRYGNQAAAAAVGVASDTLVGRRLVDLVVPEDRERCNSVLSDAVQAAGRPVQADLRIAHPDGAIRVLQATFQAVAEEGAGERWVAIIGRDVTAQREAEAEHTRLASAVEQAAEAIVMLEGDWTIQYVNPAFEQLTGYSAAEVVGRPFELLRPERFDPAVYRDLERTTRSGRVWRGELATRRKDGTVVAWEETITPVRDPAGQISGYIAISQDTSARRDLEARLRQSQKMEAVGRLAGGVAHDFNNLLTVILGYSDQLLAGLEPGTRLSRGAHAIRRAAERAAALTQQLLAFSRRQILTPRVLDLNVVVSSTEKLLRRLIGEDIELQTELSAMPACVRADPHQLEQILMNLAVNSRDAMPSGGRLTIRTDVQTFDSEFVKDHVGLQPGRYVVLTVEDTGCGMDQETMSHLFEPFFTTKAPGKGTGLGLSTIYGIVKQSDGYIWATSTVGVGTAFTICLPAVLQVEDMPARSPGADQPPSGSGTILLIEDEDEVRELLAEVLSGAGYRVLPARSGGEALELAARFEGAIDLVVTDMVMPHLSGWEVARRMAELHPTAKVLFMSGYTEHALLEQGVSTSEVTYLQKPITPAALGEAVRRILSGETPPSTGAPFVRGA